MICALLIGRAGSTSYKNKILKDWVKDYVNIL